MVIKVPQRSSIHIRRTAMKSYRDLRIVSLLAITVCLSMTVPAHAQNPTGTVFGIVTDSSGAVVPRVLITVKNIDTGATREASTSEAGEYRVSLLPIGNYQVTAALAGFKTMVRAGLKLEVQQTLRVD